ncbi:MAG: hypothetical protein D6731_16745 [Planctomycetota bacterium]|nr:MAG: hypothetical protein D6731_16745 [Planctomycetota bacterium]
MLGAPRLLLCAAALLGSATVCVGQPVPLATDWDATFEAAKQRNVPVLFLLGRDGKTPWTAWFENPKLANYLADRVLVIVGHRGGGHAPAKHRDPKTGEEVERCPVYPQLTCSVHKRFYDEKAGYFDYEELPAGFLLRPDGKQAAAGVAALSAKALQQKIEEVQFALGEGVFASEIARLERGLAKGDAYLAKGKFKAARKIYEKPLKKRLKAHLERIVRGRLEALDEAANEAIEAARDLPPKKRHETLKRIARELKGRAPEERARRVLAEVEGGS